MTYDDNFAIMQAEIRRLHSVCRAKDRALSKAIVYLEILFDEKGFTSPHIPDDWLSDLRYALN